MPKFTKVLFRNFIGIFMFIVLAIVIFTPMESISPGLAKNLNDYVSWFATDISPIQWIMQYPALILTLFGLALLVTASTMAIEWKVWKYLK